MQALIARTTELGRRLAAGYRRIARPLRVVYVAALVVVVGWYVVTNADELADLTSDMGLAAAAATVACVIGGKVVYSEQARMAYHFADAPPMGPAPFYRIYTISDMAKYLPGGVWGVAARVSSYLQLGLSGRAAARVFGFEKAALVIGAAFGGLVQASIGFDAGVLALLGADTGIGTGRRIGEVTAAVLLWAAALSAVQVAVLGRLTPVSIVRGVVEHGLICIALGATVVIPASTAIDGLGVFEGMAAFNLGRAVGLVAIFAPAGVGVREAVALWVLRDVASDEVALFALGASRVLTTLAEVLTFGVVALVARTGWMALPPAQGGNSISESP